jgi:hypothetical protein
VKLDARAGEIFVLPALARRDPFAERDHVAVFGAQPLGPDRRPDRPLVGQQRDSQTGELSGSGWA